MKYIAIILAASLAACGEYQPSKPLQIDYDLPKELDDCKVFRVDSKGHPMLYITRCNGVSATRWTQQQGKSSMQRTTVTIDGVEYVLKDKQ